ncbi:MAG: hypothetical protein AAGF04_01610 [Chlamydiota bacterium]
MTCLHRRWYLTLNVTGFLYSNEIEYTYRFAWHPAVGKKRRVVFLRFFSSSVLVSI